MKKLLLLCIIYCVHLNSCMIEERKSFLTSEQLMQQVEQAKKELYQLKIKNIVPGDFAAISELEAYNNDWEYAPNANDKILTKAYDQLITREDLIKFLKDMKPGNYTLCKIEKLNELRGLLADDNQKRASNACVENYLICQLHYIAKNGWNNESNTLNTTKGWTEYVKFRLPISENQ